MENNSTLIPLFATNVIVVQLDADCDKYLSLVKDLKFTSAENNLEHKSLISICNKLLDKKEFKELKKQFMKAFNLCNKKYLNYKNKFKIYNSWATATLKSQGSSFHNHVNSAISGVFYLQDGVSSLEFENFNKPYFDIPIEKYNVYNSQNYFITPRKGMLVFFPSQAYHKISTNNEIKERFSIAFNLLPVGLIGKRDNEFKL